jgi:hypothetical protein
MTDNGAYVAKLLTENDAYAISDGSYKDTYGTAAWLIKGIAGVNTISGCILYPGIDEDHSSYRSELSGICALVSVVNSLCFHYKITEGSITIGCYGDSALKKSFSAVLVDMDDTDKVIIAAIQSKIAWSPISWKTHYVKGHQDRNS